MRNIRHIQYDRAIETRQSTGMKYYLNNNERILLSPISSNTRKNISYIYTILNCTRDCHSGPTWRFNPDPNLNASAFGSFSCKQNRADVLDLGQLTEGRDLSQSYFQIGAIRKRIHPLLRQLPSVRSVSLESSLLLSLVLEKPRYFVQTHPKYQLNHDQYARFISLLKQRLDDTPMAYLDGTKDFWGRSFVVSDYTLIPRPASETLIDVILNLFRSNPDLSLTLQSSVNHSGIGNKVVNRILDLGTGTGCLLITLLLELNHRPSRSNQNQWLTNVDLEVSLPSTTSIIHSWHGTACDLSLEALQVAQDNARRLSVESNTISFIHSDWTLQLPQGVQYQLIVSNPPYLTRSDMDNLPRAIACYEPKISLYAGEDGLDAYRKLAEQLGDFIAPMGYLVLEIGSWQEDQVKSLFRKPFKYLSSHQDHEGFTRCLVLQFDPEGQ